jgi:hypothetical protein
MLRASRSFSPRRDFQRFLCVALIAGYSLATTACNLLPQSAAAQPSPQPAAHLSLQPSLPGATVGQAYSAALSVSGGHTPYNFAISSGQLPAGLTLDSHTGRISGNPSAIGNFAFTISVTDGSSASATGSYKVLVDLCGSCSVITISPANPSVAPSGKLQFTAMVRNASNSAVIWSASTGSISASGLFTAPANPAPKTVTITAKSAAQTSVQDSTTVTITGAGLAISTASVPVATVRAPYSTSLAASGGQPPYLWSIVSGSLPAGLLLNSSTGTLSGSATQSGAFQFSVRVADTAAHSTQQLFTLDVSASNRTCGPPTYNCSRTDFNIVRIPASVPNVGNLLGANTVVTDPDFGNRVVRITDWNTDPGQQPSNRSYVSASSGSADENLWNVDSTLFIVQSLGDSGYPFTFDPSTMQASRMYVASSPSTGGLKLPSGGMWSRADANMLYVANNASIFRYDFSDRNNPPSPQLVFDFTSSRACLPAGFDVTWQSKGGVSAGDTVFGMAYSSTGDQGTGIYAVAYKVGSGCTILNTQTGQVTGDWGATGPIDIKDRWTIHNAKLSKDGNWLIVAPQGCTSSSCSQGPYFWQIGTTHVSSCGDGKTGGQRCGGHWTEGYSHWMNNNDNGKQVIRPLSQPTAFDELTSTLPPGIRVPLDEHASWNNADPADSLPFFLTYWSPITPFPAAWYNEITGVAPDRSGRVWRFAHSFITAQSQIFSTSYGIGSVSQDGRFFIFSSDWMGTLGSQSESPTCKVGRDCRGDVFVVELN